MVRVKIRVRFGVRFRFRVRVRPFSRSREVRFWTRPPSPYAVHTMISVREAVLAARTRTCRSQLILKKKCIIPVMLEFSNESKQASEVRKQEQITPSAICQ